MLTSINSKILENVAETYATLANKWTEVAHHYRDAAKFTERGQKFENDFQWLKIKHK